jgi:hypothetical protein
MGIRAFNLHEMIMTAPMERLLSFITVLHRALLEQAEETKTAFRVNPYSARIAQVAPGNLRDALATMFREEQMAYEIDKDGGIHPLIDAEFQRNRHGALKSLSASRYENVQHDFEAAFRRLTVQDFDTKAAVRDIFDSAESLFKLMVSPRNPGLTGSTVDSDLRTVVDRALASADFATKQASGRTLSSFGKWADACHPYRHGQQSESIVAPPSELATLLLSQGASFIRWLAGLDQWLQSNPKATP